MIRLLTAGALAGLLWLTAPAAAATNVDFGPISHKGLEKVGAVSTIG